MAALITIQIPEQNFELIRTRIGEILTLELAAQTYAAGITVWKERFVPFNANELPAINVRYNSSSYDNEHLTYSRGDNEYHIDIHSKENGTDALNGDFRSSIKVERLAGIIRYILSSSEYSCLGFQSLIENRRVDSIDIGNIPTQDAMNTIVARVTFKVRAGESCNDLTPVNAEGYTTQVKLDDTDKGYRFVIDN
jgi:hypothetical protein